MLCIYIYLFRVACPCCRELSLVERDMYEICSVCNWEDEGEQYDATPGVVTGGPNGNLSLTHARALYKAKVKR